MDLAILFTDVYVRIILQFLLELYLFSHIITLKLKKRDRFPLRFFGGLAVIALLAFGVAYLYALLGNTVWGRSLIYLFLFGLTAVHIYLCYEEDWRVVLFCCSAAYVTQNLTYKLFLFFFCLGREYNLFGGWGEMFDVYYHLVYYAFIAAMVAAVYFLQFRSLARKLSGSRIRLQMLILSVVVLGVTVLMCSLEDIYFSMLATGEENLFDNKIHYILRQTGNMFSVICCFLLLLVIFHSVRSRDLLAEREYLQYQVKQNEMQYEISRDTIELINLKCHDIKYKIEATLASVGNADKVDVNELYDSVRIYDTRISTGHKRLDVLLTEKSLYCEQNGIIFSCMADGEKLSFLSDGDLYSLFGNIIDNALEAVTSIEEREKRVVNLSVKAVNDLLIIQQENYFKGELDFEDGLPKTTKSDTRYHGFGTRSIRMLVNKYDGEMTVFAKDNIFHLNIIFNLK